MSSETESHELSGISGEMMLQRHRTLLLEARLYPLAYRIQLIAVIIAAWFLPVEPIATFWVVTLVATVLGWTWIVHRQRLRSQLFAVEEAIARGAIASRREQWEDSYIRFRHESVMTAQLTANEPLLWWLCAISSIVARLPF